jgi:hypothetical protein
VIAQSLKKKIEKDNDPYSGANSLTKGAFNSMRRPMDDDDMRSNASSYKSKVLDPDE